MSQQVTSLFTTNAGKKTIRQTRWFKATSDVAPISDAEASIFATQALLVKAYGYEVTTADQISVPRTAAADLAPAGADEGDAPAALG